MTVIIPLTNHKGGVLKTTSAVTLGHGLAQRGITTLIVDTDPQGHVAFSLGLEKSSGLYKLIVEEEPLDSVAIEAGLLAPSTAEKAELDRRLAEDDATPNDTVSWETIKAEAQARWQR